MSIWEDFIAIIQTENELLKELIALSLEKQEKINDAQEVVRLASAEENIVTRLEEVDRDRAILFDAIAHGQSLEEWLSSLSAEQQEEVGPPLLELIENVGNLQMLNELNQELLAQSLSYVQFSLNLLVGDEGSPTYQRPGTSSPGKSIFDRKV